MRIQSEDGSCFIELTQREINLLYNPSVTMQIGASAYGFSATNTAWFDVHNINIFLANLVHLEQQRSGTASLLSMSPKEAILSLETVDRVGHMIARLDLTRSAHLPNQGVENQHFSIVFEIDVTLLPKLIKQLKQLIPVN